MTPGYEPLIAVLLTVAGLLRDELHGIIGSHFLSLTPRRGIMRTTENTRYSFVRPEYVNPLILADLSGWMSDSGDQVVAIDLLGANKSNRYYADEIIERPGSSFPLISARRGKLSFSYRYLGCSISGMHLVTTFDSGGGSGVFCNIMLVTLSSEPSIDAGRKGVSKRKRLVIKKIGQIPLGDRYSGKVSYRAGVLTIGPCSTFTCTRKSRKRLLII